MIYCHLSHQDVATDIAEKILKEAIDFAQAKERVEKEHARKAHSELEKALSEESKLAGFVSEAHHDAEDADQIIHTFEDMEIGEDLEKRREMAVSDISHHLEDYVANAWKRPKLMNCVQEKRKTMPNTILRSCSSKKMI